MYIFTLYGHIYIIKNTIKKRTPIILSKQDQDFKAITATDNIS